MLSPWENNPFEPVSWWTMLQFSARMFFWCGQALHRIKSDCMLGSAIVSGDEPLFDRSKAIDEKARDKAFESLKQVEAEFRKVGMGITADTVRELMEVLFIPTWEKRQNFQWLSEQIAAIESLAHKELREKVFLYIPPERAKFFPTVKHKHAFGDEVGQAFPSATYDISESAMCLALARGTACVFHLMRTLEIGLTAIGATFGVSLAHTNWAPAIEQIESKIRDMHKDPTWKALPDVKEQQEFYSQAASHFGVFKDAWRNYTAHARGKYTEEEAELIFVNTKWFMQKLSKRLHE